MEITPLVSLLVGSMVGAVVCGFIVWRLTALSSAKKVNELAAVLKAAEHPLRSQLNNILGQSQLLYSHAQQLPEEDGRLVENVLGSSGDLRKILLDTLEILDVRNNRLKLEESSGHSAICSYRLANMRLALKVQGDLNWKCS